MDSYDKNIRYNQTTVIEEVLSPQKRDLSGIFVGEVVSVSDTENRGRVQLKIYSITDENETVLPWVAPLLLTGHSVMLPEVGDKVAVMFLNGSVFSPVYLGVFTTENNYTISPDNDEDIIYRNNDSNGDESIIRKQQELDIVAGATIKAEAGSTTKETLEMTSSGTEISNTTSIATQPVVTEDRLKSFWNVIFKVFMDVNWGLITAHIHPGQIVIAPGVPVVPTPGVPTPSVSTPTMNSVGSNNLKAGVTSPMGN